MKLSSGMLSSLAATALLVAIWLTVYIQRPGVQYLASFAAGACAWVTVHLIVAAVRADARERLDRDVLRLGGLS